MIATVSIFMREAILSRLCAHRIPLLNASDLGANDILATYIKSISSSFNAVESSHGLFSLQKALRPAEKLHVTETRSIT